MESTTATAVDEKPAMPGGAAVGEPSAAEETIEFLAIHLGDEEYGINLLSIGEIIRPAAITAVPRTPAHIKGIISLRGNVIPIFDLRTRLGLAEGEQSRNTRILIVKLEKGLMGLIADRVTDVIRVGLSRIEPPPGALHGLSPGHLRGVTYVNGRLIILLDLQKVWEGSSS
ncbi:MAG TPA: chemotaxis protein CheW [Nitrospiria bacterium]